MKQKQTNLIYLTGFMGSGKSTISPILANTLGLSYLDLDQEIEKETGKRISEIFSESGEEFFREIEYRTLKKISASSDCVVSLGGGTIVSERNLQIVKSSGILLYIKVEAENILHRLLRKTNRPLLKSSDGEILNEDQLRRKIFVLFEERNPYYAQADITICSDDKKIGLTVDKIVRSLARYKKNPHSS